MIPFSYLLQSGCHDLHIILGLMGIDCGELHGNLKQTERFKNLEKFQSHNINVLIATDVAARGLDIKGVEIVSDSSLISFLSIDNVFSIAGCEFPRAKNVQNLRSSGWSNGKSRIFWSVHYSR